MKAALFGVACTISLSLIPVSVSGATVTIDMEGIAPARRITDEVSSPIFKDGFQLSAEFGHFIDADWRDAGTIRAANGSDYYGNDTLGNLTLTRSDGGPFSILRFDATDVYIDSNFIPNLVFEVTGALAGGGAVSTRFTTDRDFAFETFEFDASWSNLSSVTFVGNTHGAYDNIVVSAPVPVPAAVWLFGSGLIGLLGIARCGTTDSGNRRV